jgi:hypothetical protein
LLTDYAILLADVIVPTKVLVIRDEVPLIIPIPPSMGPVMKPYIGW